MLNIVASTAKAHNPEFVQAKRRGSEDNEKWVKRHLKNACR